MGLQERFDVSVNFNITSSGQGATAFKDMHNTLGRLPRVAAQAAAGIEKIRDAELGLAKAAMSSTRARELWNKAAIRGGQLQERFGDRAYGMQMGQQVQAMAQYRRELQAQIRPMQQAAMQQFRGMGDPTGMAYALGANQYTRQGAIGRQFAGGSSLRELRALSTEMGRVTKSGVGLSRTWQAMHRTGAVGFRAVATGAKETADATDKMNRSLGRTAVALMALFKIQQAFRDMTNLAREFHTQLVQISAIMQNTRFYQQGSPTNILAMKSDIRGMAAQYGTSRGDIAAAVNEIFQAVDVPTNTGLQIATTAIRAAKGTRTELESMTKLLLSAYNAMDLKANDLEAVSDRLITMWKDGVITFDEAQNALGKIFQAASLFGATAVEDLDKVFAAMTAVTKQGGAVQRNMTYLTNVLLELTEPKTREKLIGVGIDFTKGETTFDRNWAALMQILEQGPEFINQQFTDKRVRMGLSVLENQLSTLILMIDKMRESAGTTRDNLMRMLDDPSARLDKLREQALNLVELMGTDFIMSLDSIVGGFVNMNVELDRLLELKPELNAWAGVWRGLLETFLTLASIGVGGAAIGSLLGMGGEMAAASGLAAYGKSGLTRFFTAPAQALGRTTIGAAAGLGVSGAAAGLASPAIMTGVGAGIAAIVAGVVTISAVRQELQRQRAGFAEEARREIEDLQQELYDAATASKTFEELFTRAMQVSGTEAEVLRQDLHNIVATFIQEHQDIADKLDISVTEEGDIIMDTTGKVATSIEELQTVIQALSADNYEQVLDDIKQANEEFMYWADSFIKSATKGRAGEIIKSRGQLVKGYRVTSEQLPPVFLGTSLDRPASPEVLERLIGQYYGLPADQRNDAALVDILNNLLLRDPNVPYPSGQLDAVREWVEGYPEYYEKYKEGAFGGLPFDVFMGGNVRDIQDYLYTDELEKHKKELEGTTEAAEEGKTAQEKATELLGEQNEDQKKLNTRIEGMVSAYDVARREIEQTVQLEVETGQLKAEDVEERKRELEQQKLLPLILKTRVMKEDETLNLTDEQLIILNELLLEYGYVLDSTRLLTAAKLQELETQERINQYAEEYANSLKRLSQAMEQSAEQMLKSIESAMKPFEDASDLRGQKGQIGSAFDSGLGLALMFAKPEARPHIEQLLAPYSQYLNVLGNKAYLDTVMEQPPLQGLQKGHLGKMLKFMRTADTSLSGIASSYGVPEGTVGPFATPLYFRDAANNLGVKDIDPARAAASALLGRTDNLCAATLQQYLQSLFPGQTIPTFRTTGDVVDWLDSIEARKLGPGELAKSGDVLFWPDLMNTMTGALGKNDLFDHTAIALGDMWEGETGVPYLDQKKKGFIDIDKLGAIYRIPEEYQATSRRAWEDTDDTSVLYSLAQNEAWQAFMDEVERIVAEKAPDEAMKLVSEMFESMAAYGEYKGQFQLADTPALFEGEYQSAVQIQAALWQRIGEEWVSTLEGRKAINETAITQYLDSMIGLVAGVVGTGQAQGGIKFTGEGSQDVAAYMNAFVESYKGTPDYEQAVRNPLEWFLLKLGDLESNPEALSVVHKAQINLLKTMVGDLLGAMGGDYQGGEIAADKLAGLLDKWAPMIEEYFIVRTKEELEALAEGEKSYAEFWSSLLDEEGAAIRAAWSGVAPGIEQVILALQSLATEIASLPQELRAKLERLLDEAAGDVEGATDETATDASVGGMSPTDAAGAVTDLVSRTTSGIDPARSKVMRTRGRRRTLLRRAFGGKSTSAA